MKQLLAHVVPGYGKLLDELRRTRDRLAAVERTASSAKNRIAILKNREQRLRARLERLEVSVREMKTTFAARTLSSKVVEETTSVRLAALTRSSRAHSARAMEHEFRQRSSAYSNARTHDTHVEYETDGPVIAHGLKWLVPRQSQTDPDSLEARLLKGQLSFDTILASRELAQGTIMLDIGANIGTTCIPRVVLGDFQTVYACEPEPANYACLVQNVIANDLGGFVLPDRVAIGSSSGDVQLRVTGQIGTHHVAPVAKRRLDDAQDRLVTVSCKTLDEWVDSMAIDPDLVAFVKCDVEGWEPRVLAGARRMLGCRHIAWQLEVSPKNLTRSHASLDELCALLRESFNRFIDMRGKAGRARSTSEMDTALKYLVTEGGYTDVLLYNA